MTFDIKCYSAPDNFTVLCVRVVAKGGQRGPCPPAKTECPLAGSGTVGLTVTQWAIVDRFKILISIIIAI